MSRRSHSRHGTDRAPVSAGSLPHRIRQFLSQREAVRFDELVAALSSPRPALRAALGSLVKEGVVRLLRPVGQSADDFDCYRLCRPTDAACLWQQRYYPSRQGRELRHTG